MDEITNAYIKRFSSKNKDGSLQERNDQNWHLMGYAFREGWKSALDWDEEQEDEVCNHIDVHYDCSFCTRGFTNKEIAKLLWEDFWVEKHEYPSDIKVEQFGDWLYRAFPDWLDECIEASSLPAPPEDNDEREFSQEELDAGLEW